MQTGDNGSAWHVVVTNLGADSVVADRIANELQLKPYRPIFYRTVSAGRGRKREVPASLFPCYLLLQMPSHLAYAVRATRGVHDFLRVAGGQRLAELSAAAIEAIRAEEKRIDNKRQMRLAAEGKSEWTPGEQVWVEILPYQAMLAQVGEIDARGRIEVLLEMELFGRKAWPVEPKQLKHVEM